MQLDRGECFLFAFFFFGGGGGGGGVVAFFFIFRVFFGRLFCFLPSRNDLGNRTEMTRGPNGKRTEMTCYPSVFRKGYEIHQAHPHPSSKPTTRNFSCAFELLIKDYF